MTSTNPEIELVFNSYYRYTHLQHDPLIVYEGVRESRRVHFRCHCHIGHFSFDTEMRKIKDQRSVRSSGERPKIKDHTSSVWCMIFSVPDIWPGIVRWESFAAPLRQDSCVSLPELFLHAFHNLIFLKCSAVFKNALFASDSLLSYSGAGLPARNGKCYLFNLVFKTQKVHQHFSQCRCRTIDENRTWSA